MNAGGCEKLNPPPGAWGGMEGLAGGAGEAAGPPPKVNTPPPEALFGAPNALAPPNWKPPPKQSGTFT